ncbi:MAG: type IV pilus twitching motility protein PilT [Clostridiales bacterium]|jgi:twitching motility protein PilT|nr:type IV pilus twitching motility protein PilT [Clostridiales bacterium]
MQEYLRNLLEWTKQKGGSDIHLTVGLPPMVRVNGSVTPYDDHALAQSEVTNLLHIILPAIKYSEFEQHGEADCAATYTGIGRFRINAFKQKGNYAAVMRRLNDVIPTPDELGLPKSVADLAKLKNGLVLVTGPTGSGKSTTLASIINLINETQHKHIITLEDPIEYVHQHKKCIVNQREIGNDTKDYADALRYILRQDPDVILIGEMRDLDSISIALTAAETGHLVFSTLHTTGAAKTIDRIIDAYPPSQQQQVRVQLAGALRAVVSQSLLPKTDNSGRIAAFEIMIVNYAISNLIREDKIHLVDNSIQSGGEDGMISLDKYLAALYAKGDISWDDAYAIASDKNIFKRYTNKE